MHDMMQRITQQRRLLEDESIRLETMKLEDRKSFDDHLQMKLLTIINKMNCLDAAYRALDSYERLNYQKNCSHKDKHGEWTVIVDGQYEECTQCGLIGK